MSSEMREMIAKWHERVDVDPTNDYLLGRSEMLVECASDLLALLARTEARADGADLIQWRYTNDETGEVLTPWTECDAAFREKRKDAPGYQFRELFTRPQDASGDAEKWLAAMLHEGVPKSVAESVVRICDGPSK